MAKERCLTCMTWHEPDQHVTAEPVPETLTGQVPIEVSGNQNDA